MKILITGGAGFIGSHVAKILLDLGHQVIVYDNLSKSSQDNLDKRALFIKGDIKDRELLKKTLLGIDWVIHLASLIEVNESVKKPVLYADNNVLGTVELLEAMREVGVKKIIFSSSACVYGTPKTLPLTEASPLQPDNPYGASKVAVEAFLRTYHILHHFDVTILRYFNPYGPGENHQPETHAIPNFIKAALDKRPIPLYWEGEQIRDFIYIEDLATAHTTCLNLKGFSIFNVGTNNGVKVIDVVNKLSDIFGYDVKIENLGERAGDVNANYASSALLKSKAGWEAKVSLDEGLKKTVEYFKSKSS
ncbi:UDP-glucose 4-epimerase GalE [Candidatus Daviesbacteria bacterium]|nr:UDP-glucose 4-epimerase GalE [Candidatus Daviesbacteria bacterium]